MLKEYVPLTYVILLHAHIYTDILLLFGVCTPNDAVFK